MFFSTGFINVVCQKSEVVAQFGSNTLLDCVVRPNDTSDSVQIEKVTWKLNGAPVLEFFRGKQKLQTPGFQFASGPFTASNMNVSLLITNTNLSHVGEYQCDVVTDIGDDKKEVHLEVRATYSKPQIKSDPEKINPDKSFTLTCTALGGFPKGDIRWVVGDLPWINNPEVKVEKNQNGLFNLTSTLPFGSETKFRKFVCEVYNAKGEKEGEPEHHVTNVCPGKPFSPIIDLLNSTITSSEEEVETGDAEADPSITLAEVEVVGELLGGKSPGVDEICPKYLKSLDVG
uniref:Ig-like domain-containing protein n=1 Tax=Periophthalmus magnuspinnatus TaxID=409849 RepID=A0A3B3Z991_9GOBI